MSAQTANLAFDQNNNRNNQQSHHHHQLGNGLPANGGFVMSTLKNDAHRTPTTLNRPFSLQMELLPPTNNNNNIYYENP